MTYPNYQDIEVPLLVEIYKRGGKVRPSERGGYPKDIYETMADFFQLSKEERERDIEVGGKVEPKWNNMVRWARRKLKDNGYLVSPSKHGVWEISDEGKVHVENLIKNRKI
ncbi:MAG: winged helix-turn-helix domain-containing protein [Proteobacteria bacterium]|nr:winged helix-turn-helix domain-containing protein [Pseudomonadota bacterium]